MSQTLLAIRAYAAKPLTGPVNIQRDKRPEERRAAPSQRSEREGASFLHYLQQVTNERAARLK